MEKGNGRESARKPMKRAERETRGSTHLPGALCIREDEVSKKRNFHKLQNYASIELCTCRRN
jgi:hypothetical protein